jgi:transposase
MIDYQQFCQIKQHQAEGLKAAQIAAAEGLDERTARKWMAEPRYRPRQSASRPSKLDVYRDRIRAWLERHPFSAAQIYQKLRQEGYAGGVTIVKDYVRLARPPRRPAFLSLSFAPGECAQVDWGQYGTIPVGTTRRRLSFFVLTMGFSRLLFVAFTLSERMEQWLACHVRAFEFLGGVPRRIMIDNLRSAVLCHPPGGPACFHPRYLELAAHFGFEPVACPLGQAHHKGRVERSVGYIKHNLLDGQELAGLPALELEGRRWLDEVANQRVHRDTRRKPAEAFVAEEKPALLPLPIRSFDSSVTLPVRASRQFRAEYDGNRYSVPSEYAGQLLTLKAYADRLLFYHRAADSGAHNLVAEHLRSYDRGRDVSNPEHERALLVERRRARSQQVYRRFLLLTPQADAFYAQLRERRLNPLVHLRKIVALVDVYGPAPVAQAIEDALHFQAFSSEYILHILQQRGRQQPPPGPLHLPHKQELLELELPEPDCSLYDTDPQPENDHE